MSKRTPSLPSVKGKVLSEKEIRRLVRSQYPRPGAVLRRRKREIDIAPADKFVVAKYFQLHAEAHPVVQFAEISPAFCEWFHELVEEKRGAEVLCTYIQLRSAYDTEIVAALGGDRLAAVTLSEIYSLLNLQGHGESGILQTRAKTNVFYAIDSESILRCVITAWNVDGWHISAFALGEGCVVERAWENRIFARLPIRIIAGRALRASRSR